MGFLSGRVSFARFRVSGSPPRSFGADKLEKLAEHAIGTQKLAAADGVEIGWTAGEHVLDTRFDLAKNVVNDALHFGFRVDTEKAPADLFRAYTAIELHGIAPMNPSSRHKREAREAARERLEREAKDGRYTRRKVYDVLWDAPSNELLIAASGTTVLDRLHEHFHKTFNRKFEPLTAGTLAFALAETRQETRGVDDARPSPFVPGAPSEEVAWLQDDRSRDFLGNEFLLWLWHRCEVDDDTLDLSDKTDVAILPARTLTLECPLGQTGKESITSDGPTRLPEAKRAIQSGKWPRKCGLTLQRQGAQYELTLSAETLAVGGAKLPVADDIGRAETEERITQIRHLVETLDLMFDAFGRVRCGAGWGKELTRMQKWLTRAERGERQVE